MHFFRTGKFRFLYLLALVQLVGGPLVLLQVTVFCKLALHEAPRAGAVKAAELAWNSNEFQGLIHSGDTAVVVKDRHGKPSPAGETPDGKMDKLKQPPMPWLDSLVVWEDTGVRCKPVDRARVWTPAWPQAPPGPPPRVG